MPKRTPPLGTKGRYVLRTPWSTNPTMLYTCLAIRSFDDIYKLGYDVYSTYYVPMGLTNGAVVGGLTFQFDAERNATANIITLRATDGTYIYVPDTYIASYPDMSEHTYSHMVLSVSLGALPDYLDLSAVKDAVSGIVAQTFGLTPTVKEHRTPSTANPTAAQHEAMEASRTAAITLLETDHARALRYQGLNLVLQDKINALTAILSANNLLPRA